MKNVHGKFGIPLTVCNFGCGFSNGICNRFGQVFQLGVLLSSGALDAPQRADQRDFDM